MLWAASQQEAIISFQCCHDVVKACKALQGHCIWDGCWRLDIVEPINLTTWNLENNAPEVFDKVPKMLGCETNYCRMFKWKSGVHVGYCSMCWPIKSLYSKTNQVLTHVGGVSLFLELDWEAVKAIRNAQRLGDKLNKTYSIFIKVVDELQQRSNILDFTEDQQVDCTDLKSQQYISQDKQHSVTLLWWYLLLIHRFREEIPRSDLNWLNLAVTLLKALFGLR